MTTLGLKPVTIEEPDRKSRLGPVRRALGPVRTEWRIGQIKRGYARLALRRSRTS